MDVTIIKIVRNTLNTINVRGKDDISAMLGCMEALEQFIQAAEAENSKESEVVDNG